MIFLFTDFGAADIYVGQVKAVLHRYAPRVPVIDLLHDAPSFHVQPAAHLLAALATRLPARSVVMAVVDPGVGGARAPVAVKAGGRWLVGPDNGLLSVIAARAAQAAVYSIGWRPKRLSASFHGRDLFAPVAAMLARNRPAGAQLAKTKLAVHLGAGDLAEIVYVDHYGNLVTGIRAGSAARHGKLTVRRRSIAYARVFSDVPERTLFWYENSLGLAEIAANSMSAQELLHARLGDAVT